MSCLLCGSGIRQLTAEMVIHFSARKNLDKPGVWVFPKLLVCLDCGCSRLTVPKKELASARLTLANLAGPNTKGLNLNSRFVIAGLRGYLHRRFCWLPGPVDAQCWQAGDCKPTERLRACRVLIGRLRTTCVLFAILAIRCRVIVLL